MHANRGDTAACQGWNRTASSPHAFELGPDGAVQGKQLEVPKGYAGRVRSECPASTRPPADGAETHGGDVSGEVVVIHHPRGGREGEAFEEACGTGLEQVTSRTARQHLAHVTSHVSPS